MCWKRVRRAGGHDRRVRLHEPPPHEAAQILGDGRPARVGRRARRRPPRGRPAPPPTRCRHRRAGRRRAGRAGPRGARGSSAGRARRRRRRGRRRGDAVLDQRREQLLDEERVAFRRGLDDRRSSVGGEHRALDSAADELRRLGGREPVELDGGSSGAARPAVAVARASSARAVQRTSSGAAVAPRGGRPGRASSARPSGDPRNATTSGPRRAMLDAARAKPQKSSSTGYCLRRSGRPPPRALGDGRVAGRELQHLRPGVGPRESSSMDVAPPSRSVSTMRPERDPLPVREAAAARARWSSAGRGADELRDQARLADARRRRPS